MKVKEQKPNYKFIYKSTVSALQDAYSMYKKEYMKLLKYTWYNDNGEFCILNGYEKISQNITDYENQVNRYKLELEELKEKMKEEENDN